MKTESRQGWAELGWGKEAEAWPDPVDGKVLLDELAWVFKRHVVLPPRSLETLALWTLHTYAYHLGEVSTYLGIESPEKRCGKTTLLGVLSDVVNRPVVAANISPPAFFRVIEETRPTLLIDEADTFLPGHEELRGILNSGYSRKTAYVLRVANEVSRRESGGAEGEEKEAAGRPAERTERPRAEKGGAGSQLARFSCWCPKAVAALGRLPETLADRCIVIRMHRKMPNEECERLKNLDAGGLRRQCVRFVRDHEGAIAEARPEIPAGLNDRAADIWEPLLALADLGGGVWPQVAREAAVELSGGTEENEAIGWLFWDIYVLFGAMNQERLFSRELVMGLESAGDRPWSELRNGRGVTEMWLAQRLRPYGIRPRTMWIGKAAAKGYDKADFDEAFVRYIPHAQVKAWVAQSKAAAKAEQGEGTVH